jgi:pimeloyl-ACP methyl ester carboxylesterase
MSRADDWLSRGSHFSWRPAEQGVGPVEIFHVEIGDPDAPVLLLIHGWPTSSIDWLEVAGQLHESFRVCALDFPGYGFSAKPPGWGYSLARDEELIEFYLQELLGRSADVVVAHDRGDSVALLHAVRCAQGQSVARFEHLVLSNGNVFLPLSNLTAAQRQMLDEQSWQKVAPMVTPSALAGGLGASTFTPPRAAGDPEVEALSATFSYNNGTQVLHETIQYLLDRAAHEQEWLTALAEASFPVTLIWGLCDTVSPPRVASYLWNEYLMRNAGRNRLYFIPDANHYLQLDRPDAFVQVLRHALGSTDHTGPGPLTAGPGAPILVDSSRQQLPAAADVLRAEPPAGPS